MTCEEYRSELIEVARRGGAGGNARRHATLCAECRALLERQVALTAVLRRVENEASAAEVASVPNAALFWEFDNVHRGKTVTYRNWWFAAAIAAALILSLFVAWPRGPKPASGFAGKVVTEASSPAPPAQVAAVSVRVPAVRHRRRRPRGVREPSPAFIQIPYTLPLAPYERAAVVRMEMPVAALIAAGMAVAPGNTGGRAQADVLVGDDGRARAIRVVSISNE